MKIMKNVKLHGVVVKIFAVSFIVYSIITALPLVVYASEVADGRMSEEQISKDMVCNESDYSVSGVNDEEIHSNADITSTEENEFNDNLGNSGQLEGRDATAGDVTKLDEGGKSSEEANNNETVTEIDMGDYSDTMYIGEKQLLAVHVLPVGMENIFIEYSSSDETVATINGMGRISAIAEGTTCITAVCQGKKASFLLSVKDGNVPVSEIDIAQYMSEMEVGSSQLLSATPLPVNAANKITYKSSDTSVATVNSIGRISALKVGVTTITIECGDVTSSIQISVVKKRNEVEEVTDIEISDHKKEVEVDKTLNLSAKVLPLNVIDCIVAYKSSDERIATVNSSGEVKGISPGMVTITITAGKITKEEIIKVKVASKKISMNSDYLVLKTGESYTLTGKVFPSDAVQTLTYKSIDTSIATVTSGGVVTAQDVGSTSIIVSNGDIHAAVSVIVNADAGLPNNDMEEGDNTSKVASEKYYSGIISAIEREKVDSEMLKYFYKNNRRLQIIGDGYEILLNGDDIVNYMNELNTDIELQEIEENGLNNSKGMCFVINEGNPICGDMTLYLDDINGKYLYLYNEAKEQYEAIASSDLSKIRISSPGKYLITHSKINNADWSCLTIGIIGGLILIAGIGIYVGTKKQYWFW